MCDDQAGDGQPGDGQPDAGGSGVSRRHALHATAAAAAAAAVLRRNPRLPLHSPARDRAADGTAAYSMAMHVHSSFSEQTGSMDSQLFQAARNAVDVLWWTDHDVRMTGLGYRKTVHFTSLTQERGGPGQRGPWIWTKVESGPLAAGSGGGIVAAPCSPNDPVTGGSLNVSATSRSAATAKYGYYANSHPAGWNYRDNLTGQSLAIDVLLRDGWTRGYLEMLIGTSLHPAIGGRPAGRYTLSYRFVPAGERGGRSRQGIHGVVTIPVQSTSARNPWCTVTVTPAADIAALWPDLDYRDFALAELTLSAVSEGRTEVSGYFDYLRFRREVSGEASLDQQASMTKVLARRYPSVVQRQGLEVSRGLPHINWFGGAVVIPDYGRTTGREYQEYLRHTAIPQIHAVGGLASYNHPYGYGDPKPLPVGEQDALLAQVARALLPTKTRRAALGADLLEVGYILRQGVDLAHHVALWDVMSRNAVFLTGNGSTDDHFGSDWLGIKNNWITSTWATSTSERALLASLAAGRAWCGSLSHYRGSLDLLVDGSCPMGSVSVSRVTARNLVATATAIPAGGSLEVLQGAVDYAGAADPAASTVVIGSYPASRLARGPVAQRLDTSQDSFVRTQVLSAEGKVIGLSNPVWLLRRPPPDGIPPRRAA
jgi:hypothetical protein